MVGKVNATGPTDYKRTHGITLGRVKLYYNEVEVIREDNEEQVPYSLENMRIGRKVGMSPPT